MRNRFFFRAISVCFGSAGIATQATARPELIELGTLGGTYSWSNSISGDGSTVVGVSSRAGSQANRAFRWTAGTGMVDLHDTDQDGGTSECTNRDGTIIAGTRVLASGHVPFVWQGGVTTHLPTLGGVFASAFNISDDGSVVVGFSTASGSYPPRACVWRDGGIFDLGTLGGPGAYATATTANGLVIVGAAHDSTGKHKPFRWTMEDGMHQLPVESGHAGWAVDISADGNCVVGKTWPLTDLSLEEAVVWVHGTASAIGTLGGKSSSATCTNQDGTLVGGTSYIKQDMAIRPFVWSRTRGMIDLQEYLSRSGVDVSGWDMRSVSDFSHDGSVLVGTGFRFGEQRGFMIRDFVMPCPADIDLTGFVDTDDFTAFVLAFEAGTNDADFDGTGFVDTDDFTAFVLAFEAGC